ncbi:MAG: tRNA (adenosine(37)-N6)-dimethylallyltransferase MiaA, partial [Candidatus Limnocylindrales bacterium]
MDSSSRCVSSAPAHTPCRGRFSTPDEKETQDWPPLVVLAGATATGKTSLSLSLAEAIPGAEIISADSRQVYRGMDIGTAKVSADDRARVPHHGIDLVEPDEPFSAANYLRVANDALHEIAARGGVALLVGGTGLYLRAVARGFSLQDTGHDPETRTEIEERLESEGVETLADELRALAPMVAATTDLANPRRVVRALERARIHGDRPPPAPRGYPARSVWIGLHVEPETHRAWIDERARAQFATGLVDEAAALRERYDSGLRSFSAVGYREAFAYIDRELSFEQAIELDITRNSQFARRQRTWFRAEPDVTWLDATSS